MPAHVDVPMDKIRDFCKRWKIIELSLFGSVLRDDFRADSDVDVLVTFAPNESWSLLDLIAMRDELKMLFGREVDLAEERSELARCFRRVQSHHADRRGVVEEYAQDRALAHEAQLEIVLAPLVEERGEFLLAQDTRHFARGGEAAGDQRGDRVGVGPFGAPLLRDEVAVLVDEQSGLRLRAREEVAQGAVDLLDVLLAEDKPRVAQLRVGHLTRVRHG